MRIFNQKPISEVRKENKEKEVRESNITKVPIIENDVQETAEMTAYVLEDSAMIAELAAVLLEDSSATAEVLAMALEKINELEARLEQLEGGK